MCKLNDASLSVLEHTVQSQCSDGGPGPWDLSLCSKMEVLSALQGPLLVSYCGTWLYILLMSRGFQMSLLQSCSCPDSQKYFKTHVGNAHKTFQENLPNFKESICLDFGLTAA